MSGFVKKVQRKFGIHKDSTRKAKLARDLIDFQKCVEHGFPHKPTAVSYDAKLNLVALGTKAGAVKVYGAPGVELYGVQDNGAAVKNLYFLPDQGRLISIDGKNTLHLWEINHKDNGSTVLEEVKTLAVGTEDSENPQNQVSVCCLTADAETLLIGTEGGNILLLDVPNFSLKEKVIKQDDAIEKVAEDFKLSPGAVEAIAQHPTEADKFLIGYAKGLIVFWDNAEAKAEHHYNGSQQLESLDWHYDGKQFITAHNDGSYIIWDLHPENETSGQTIKPTERATTPYGPFPCKSINKILWKTAPGGPFIIMSGGMPRASYGDHNTVSVMQGVNQVVFDVTSKIVDFITIDQQGEGEERPDSSNPNALIILAEEEMIVIDLASEGWPTFQLPYLSSMHSSAITCAHHVSSVSEETWNKIGEAGKAQSSKHTARDWPITGGQQTGDVNSTGRDLLLTGHEDGTIRFWDASTPDALLMYKLSTSDSFEKDEGAGGDAANEGEEEWPPFRKVGTFDPYSDDPRLGIQKITFDAVSETLVAAGSAGQVIVLNLKSEETTFEVKTFSINIVNDRDNLVWKGHEALHVQGGDLTFQAGFQPTCVMQMMPPAACTALTIHATWQLVAAGTAHGFTLFDYTQKKEIISKCTLTQDHAGEANLSRGRKFTQSLRNSIRRLRDAKRRNKHAETKKEKGSPKKQASKEGSEASASEAKPAETEPEKKEEAAASEEKKEEEKKDEATGGEEPAAAAPAPAAATPTEPKKEASPVTTPSQEPMKPVERVVEARGSDEQMNSIVKSIYFADTFILDATTHCPSLWAGTNGGIVFVYKITLPEEEKRDSDAVQCDLCKEIKLRHRAPVIAICVLDKNGTPLPHPNQVASNQSKAADMSGSHSLLICSEEQMKVFYLPQLKAKQKQKITAHDGCRIRRVDVISITSKNDEEYISYGVAILNNQGEISLFNVPQLSLQLKYTCIKKEDILGINSCVFTRFGEGFYLGSPSEFVRFAITARHSVKPSYTIELKEGMRPAKPEPEPETKEEEKEAAAEGEEASKDEEATSESEKKDDGADAETSVADDSKVEEPATDITIDSVKEYMTSSSEAQSSVTVEKSFSSSMTTKTTTEVTEVKSSSDGQVQVESTTTTSETTVQDGSDKPEPEATSEFSSNTTSYTIKSEETATLEKLGKEEMETSEQNGPVSEEDAAAQKLEEMTLSEQAVEN